MSGSREFVNPDLSHCGSRYRGTRAGMRVTPAANYPLDATAPTRNRSTGSASSRPTGLGDRCPEGFPCSAQARDPWRPGHRSAALGRDHRSWPAPGDPLPRQECPLRSSEPHYERMNFVRTYTIVVEPDETGDLVVSVPALPGCFTRGKSLDECRQRAAEAIEVHIAGLRAEGEPVPEEIGTPQLLPVTVAA